MINHLTSDMSNIYKIEPGLLDLSAKFYWVKFHQNTTNKGSNLHCVLRFRFSAFDEIEIMMTTYNIYT